MAFDPGANKGGVRPAINVTPLVDVVLVLLIIFMVITPLLQKHFSLNIPLKDDKEEKEPPPPDARPPVVLTVKADGSIWLNREAVAVADLQPTLQRVFAARRENTLFFAADDSVEYGLAMEVMDRARGGGAFTLAVLAEAPKP